MPWSLKQWAGEVTSCRPGESARSSELSGNASVGVGEGTAMRVENAVNIEDLHRLAKRRLPKIAFDYIEGGIEDERGLERNTSAFHKHRLLPRYLVDVSVRDQSRTIFGQKFSS